MKSPKTLFEKIWENHVVYQQDDGVCLLHIDRHLLHEVTSPQAFEGLRQAGRPLLRPDATLAVPDHNVSTVRSGSGDVDPQSAIQLHVLMENCEAYGVPVIPLEDARQGIVHIVGPEQGFTQPGTTIVCGDSHTSTHGAFGALAFGIGTSEVEHVMATQTLYQRPAKSMRITLEGEVPLGVTAKDLALAITGKIGTAGGTGYVIEYAGEPIRNLSMEGRMTLCNMTIEGGARTGLIAPDEKTFDYLRGRPMAPSEVYWNQAVTYWESLHSDVGAQYEKEVTLNVDEIEPQVTWGTSPEDVLPISGAVPSPDQAPNAIKAEAIARALVYMGLEPHMKLAEILIDTAFIGSCTNGRIEDLRAVAAVAKGRKVADHVRALIVPGSGLVKRQAEAEGLHQIFLDAGFEWRDPGCSMCIAMNEDRLKAGDRCASTSNRNFEDRQGPGGRTHLMSPAMAAAAAIAGHLTDSRNFLDQ